MYANVDPPIHMTHDGCGRLQQLLGVQPPSKHTTEAPCTNQHACSSDDSDVSSQTSTYWHSKPQTTRDECWQIQQLRQLLVEPSGDGCCNTQLVCATGCPGKPAHHARIFLPQPLAWASTSGACWGACCQDPQPPELSRLISHQRRPSLPRPPHPSYSQLTKLHISCFILSQRPLDNA
jgi:hypothetical protein